MKKYLLKMYYLIQLQKFNHIDISQLNYHGMCHLLDSFHDNEIIMEKIITSGSFLKLLQEEDGNTLKIFQTMYFMAKSRGIEENIMLVEKLLDEQLIDSEIKPFEYLIDITIDMYFKQENQRLEELIYDLVSKFLHLGKLSNNMIKFYLITAIKQEHLNDVVNKVKFVRGKSGNLAAFWPVSKSITCNKDKIDYFFNKENFRDYLTLNRFILQALEHELDHVYVNKFYSAYNVLDKRRLVNKEFYYFHQSNKIYEQLKEFENAKNRTYISQLYIEHRANTFGYLKSLKRIKKNYGRFISRTNYNKISNNTLQNIIMLYIHKHITPYQIQANLYKEIYRFKKPKTDFSEEFIPMSFIQTKELFENIFEREFNEETLMELHRIMIGSDTLYNSNLLDKNIAEENGFEVLNEIATQTTTKSK